MEVAKVGPWSQGLNSDPRFPSLLTVTQFPGQASEGSCPKNPSGGPAFNCSYSLVSTISLCSVPSIPSVVSVSAN